MNKPLRQTYRTWLWLLPFLWVQSVAWAQVALPSNGTYSETFDGIASKLPDGWTVRTGATATSLGTSTTYVTATTTWNNTAGNFRNVASADGLTSTATITNQSNSADRALGVRQGGALGGDPGAAFVLQLGNTTGLQNFQLSFKLQNLDPSSPRTTTWRVDYGIGATPASFTPVTITGPSTTGGTVATGTSFSNNTLTVSFGSALDNNAGPVWIRIVALAGSAGSGTRPTTGIDDVVLNYSSTSANPVATLSATPTTLTGYVATQGTASDIKQYVLTGTNLESTAVSVSATNGVELSTNGTDFTPTLTITPASGNVSQTVYARLANTVGTGTFSGTITNTWNSTLVASVTVSGQVNAVNNPTLTATPNTLGNFTTIQGTASGSQSYVLAGSNLGSPIAVSAPAGFAVSTSNDANSFGSTADVPAEGGTVYARLTGASAGSVSGTITNISGSLTANVEVSGTVNNAGVTLTKISTIQGSGSASP
ncbi:MAG TPA: hypothetical protein VGB67_10295, partial [Fibrella sp.]